MRVDGDTRYSEGPVCLGYRMSGKHTKGRQPEIIFRRIVVHKAQELGRRLAHLKLKIWRVVVHTGRSGNLQDRVLQSLP
jgi:hypothetical protein